MVVAPNPSQKLAASCHLRAAESILAELKTSAITGLTAAAAADNLAKYGDNELPETKPRSGLVVFLGYFWSIPVALLTVAALLSLATDSQVDALVIMGVVVINAILGYVTESRSERIILSLDNLVDRTAWVIRDGKPREIEARTVAVGDILKLKPGSYVAADARLIKSDRLRVDESALTGESVPVLKTCQTLTATVPLSERTNMVYRGTLVTGGQGLGVVVATGQQTEMGRIQTLVGSTTMPQTPLERQLDRASGQLILLSSSVCCLVLGLGIMRGYGWLEMLKTAIALAVAAVPEGLPTVATITLALGINTMRQQRVLVRRLDAIEALGSVQTICLDKTGTLTTNEMSVVEIQTLSNKITLEPGQSCLQLQSDRELSKLVEVAILCNESEVKSNDDGRLVIEGSPTEKALMQLAIAAGLDLATIQARYPKLTTAHRTDGQNYMATVHQLNPSQKFIAVKGNPLEVLALCNYKLDNGQPVLLTELDRRAIAAVNQQMTILALRVLGTAYADDTTEEPDNLTWLGLIGLANPIRPGVKELIADFHRAGIDTVMITGDQENTAQAIAKQLNLNNNYVRPCKGEGWFAPNNNVFARISPADKLKIVRAFQQAGKVVAMTGDGINDAPALKAAEVGIAMGRTGTDVAREVADIVLADDNLATAVSEAMPEGLIAAVSQGRTIYSNIKKALHFLLATNLSEIIVMVLANLLGIGQPLNAIQLLWLNLVTDIFPGLALGLEAPEPNVLTVPPRPSNAAIIAAADFKRLGFEAGVISVCTLVAYGYGIANYGIGDRPSTIAFMSLVTAQLLHTFSCRSSLPFWQAKLESNHYLTLALSISLGLQFICLLIPYLGRLLSVTAINWLDGTIIVVCALLPLIINEVTKKVSL